MQVDSHTQRDQTFVFHSGAGTMEFPASQIAEIQVLPDDPKAANLDPAKNVVNTDALLAKAAASQGLEPEFVRSVARIESGLRQDAISVKGAVGLMQLMPGTAALLGVDAKVAEDNALGGAKFLRELLLKYGGDPTLALAAYNAGPGAVQKFKGVPPYMETRQYIVKVLREYQKQIAAQAKILAVAPVAPTK